MTKKATIQAAARRYFEAVPAIKVNRDMLIEYCMEVAKLKKNKKDRKYILKCLREIGV